MDTQGHWSAHRVGLSWEVKGERAPAAAPGASPPPAPAPAPQLGASLPPEPCRMPDSLRLNQTLSPQSLRDTSTLNVMGSIEAGPPLCPPHPPRLLTGVSPFTPVLTARSAPRWPLFLLKQDTEVTPSAPRRPVSECGGLMLPPNKPGCCRHRVGAGQSPRSRIWSLAEGVGQRQGALHPKPGHAANTSPPTCEREELPPPQSAVKMCAIMW